MKTKLVTTTLLLLFFLENPLSSAQTDTVQPAEDRRTLVDLSDPKEALLNSVVLVTGYSDFVYGKREYNWGWGSGFLVSKCHILTAHHVVFTHERKNSEKPEKILEAEETPKLGKIVRVGLIRTNSALGEKEKISGKVIGFDKDIKIKLGTREEYNRGRDWALIKIDKDSMGAYPTEDKTPLCLNKIESPIRTQDVMKMKIRAVGYPGDKFLSTMKISLWQDPNCEIIGKDGESWRTSCQLRKGMSGGPVVTYLDLEKCWMPVGVISGQSLLNDGFTKSDEASFDNLNTISPLSKRTREMLEKVMAQYPCE